MIKEGKRMNEPLTADRVPVRSLDDCLKMAVKWSKTDDATAFWNAPVGAAMWTVRVNDFPEERLYTLYVDDSELGSFDDWPRQWSRTAGRPNGRS
jgi:hypothetical protein